MADYRRRRTRAKPYSSGDPFNWLTIWAVGRYDLGIGELEFWQLTLEEFEALRARDRAAEEFQEYCGALAAWAVFNTARGKGQPFRQVTDFMLQRVARGALAAPAHPPDARPAAPPPPVMRYARPGERPPSRFAKGSDNVIEKFDAWARKRR